MIVSCKNLDQFYGPTQVLHDVSLSVQTGCTGLLGNNGAGKSTLIKTLLSQLPVATGKVQLAGFDPAVRPLKVRQQVGYMPENDVYISGLSGFEFVAYCGQLYGMPRMDAISRAHQVLHYVGLGEARYRAIDDYSTGMRQRAKLAACLVHGPELLLLDEPTTGLDPAGREQMLDLIDNVSHKCGVSVLFSSHILRDIEQTCEQLVVLNEGRVLFCGPRKDFQEGTGLLDEGLMSEVKSAETQVHRYLLRVKAGRKKMAEALEAKGYAVEIEMTHLEVDLPMEIQPEQVWALARAQGLQLRHLAPLGESLEDAYNRALVDKGPVRRGGAS